MVAAKVATEARIGPLQGVQTTPRARPVTKPPEKSLRWFFPIPPNLPLIEEIDASMRRDRAGTTIEIPMTRRTTTAIFRSTLGLKPIELSSAEIARVKKANEIATPAVIPRGRRFEFD